jgi:hypothetical protein
MALSFRYAPGGLNARFYHSTFDYIELDLRMGGETTWVQEYDPEKAQKIGDECRVQRPSVEHTVYFSSLWCAFPAFIRFLEAITIGVEECGFSWDPEGPDGRMRWKSSGGAEGSFRLQWYAGATEIDQSTRVHAYDVVETLYSAFRTFVESPEYEPFRYERMREWDAYSLVLADASLGDFARAVAMLPAAEAGAVLARAMSVALDQRRDASEASVRSHPLEWFLLAEGDADAWHSKLPAAWDTWGEARRRRYLGRSWARTTVPSWDGSSLRRLRSARIEEWLARKGRTSRRAP